MPRDEAAAVLPSADVIQIRPSREFAVRQAVLTALHEYFPSSIRMYGVRSTAEFIGSHMTAAFKWCVGKHFRALQARYDLREI